MKKCGHVGATKREVKTVPHSKHDESVLYGNAGQKNIGQPSRVFYRTDSGQDTHRQEQSYISKLAPKELN
jgi:hypothetical protein